MATVTFSNGMKANFNGTPTEADIDEVAQKMGIQPSSNGSSQSQNSSGYVSPLTGGANDQSVAASRAANIAEGKPVSVNPNKVDPSFGGSIVRGLLNLPVRMIQNLKEAAAAATGDQQGVADAQSGNVNSPYLGTEYPIGSGVDKNGNKFSPLQGNFGKSVLDSVGAGTEAASYLAGGEEAPAVVGAGENVVKKGILESALQGAKTGAKVGLLGGAGAGAQQAAKETSTGAGIEDVAAGAGEGLAGGGITGGVLGAGGNVVSKIPYAANVAKAAVGGTPSDAASKTAEDAIFKEVHSTVGDSLPQGVRQNQEAILKATGSNGFTPMARFGIVPGETSDGHYDLSKAIPAADAVLEKANGVLNRIKSQETGTFNLDDMIRKTLDDQDKKPGDIKYKDAFADELVGKIDRNVKPVRTDPTTGDRYVDADGAIKLRQLADEEAGFAQGNSTNKQAQKVLSSPWYDLRSNISSNINDNATLPEFKEANKQVSDLISTKHILESLEGKKVPQGGLVAKLSRHGILSAAGGILSGNPFGAILGNMGADQLDKLFTDPEIKTSLARAVLKANPNTSIEDLSNSVENSINKRATSPVPKTPPAEADTTLGRLRARQAERAGTPASTVSAEDFQKEIKKNPSILGKIRFNKK